MAEKFRYIKFMPKIPFSSASRNKREIKCVEELGADITVICRDAEVNDINFSNCKFIKSNVKHISSSFSRLKRMTLILENYYSMIKQIRMFDADVISCHNLDSLILAYLGNYFKKKKPYLVYDSHEFEIGRNQSRNAIMQKFIVRLERIFIKKCAFSIMVNDSIADEVQKIHKLKDRPVVVRSTPEKWTCNVEKTEKLKSEIGKKFGINGEFCLCMYHGGVLNGRGIEQCIQAVSKLSDVYLLVLGNSVSDTYKQSLINLAKNNGCENRVLFHDAVPMEDLKIYISAVDISFSLIQPVCTSYYYALPNKLFEAIQGETPIIASDLPEISRVINKYGIGLCVKHDNIDEIISAIKKLREDTELYSEFKTNLKNAKEDLCWESEKNILKKAYSDLLDI